MKKLLALLVLASCQAELPQEVRMFEGDYDVAQSITVTDQYGTLVSEGNGGIPTYWSFERDSIRVFTMIDSQYVNINGRALPATFDKEGKPASVGCRMVIEVTDTSITWVQQEGSVNFPWLITKVLKKR